MGATCSSDSGASGAASDAVGAGGAGDGAAAFDNIDSSVPKPVPADSAAGTAAAPGAPSSPYAAEPSKTDAAADAAPAAADAPSTATTVNTSSSTPATTSTAPSTMSSSATSVINRVVLVSIDGWGISSKTEGNAIANARAPNMQRYEREELFTQIDASGLSVGLPKGIMGNSEVGHLTMGAGRISFQDLVRINQSLEEKTFFTNPTLLEALARAKSTSQRVHFLGLVSDGAVHSHIEHLEAFVQTAKTAGVPQCFVHFFGDGRDTKPTSATQYIERLQAFLAAQQYGKIATVTGRYYAMDRDKRWERVQVAYDGLVSGKGESTSNDKLVEAVKARYAAGENDEFLKPLIVDSEGLLRDNDTLVFINFRSDRMREIVSVFAPFHHATDVPASSLPFASEHVRQNLHVVQMTQYDEKVKLPIVFPPQTSENGLSEWLSKHHLRQFHTAETEKYAHVTFFFNGGREEAFAAEDRKLVASPKVPTYDQLPEMSQSGVADSVIEAVKSGNYPFIMCNFAAPDMVGHTGVYEAAVKACTVCDESIGRIEAACREHGYVLVVTADHGNAEEMLDENGKPKTSHTTNLIPLIVVKPKAGAPGGDAAARVQWTDAVKSATALPTGGLSDVAPTVLAIMGLPIPKEMTGHSLVRPLV